MTGYKNLNLFHPELLFLLVFMTMISCSVLIMGVIIIFMDILTTMVIITFMKKKRLSHHWSRMLS